MRTQISPKRPYPPRPKNSVHNSNGNANSASFQLKTEVILTWHCFCNRKSHLRFELKGGYLKISFYGKKNVYKTKRFIP